MRRTPGPSISTKIFERGRDELIRLSPEDFQRSEIKQAIRGRWVLVRHHPALVSASRQVVAGVAVSASDTKITLDTDDGRRVVEDLGSAEGLYFQRHGRGTNASGRGTYFLPRR